MSRRTSEAPGRLVDANIFLFGKDAEATQLLGIVNACPMPDPTYRNFGTLVTDKKIFNNVDDSVNYNFACSARFPSSDSSHSTDITYQSVACLAYTNTNINNNYASYINWDIDWPLYGTTFGCFYAGPANKGHSWCWAIADNKNCNYNSAHDVCGAWHYGNSNTVRMFNTSGNYNATQVSMQWQWIEVTIGYDGTATMYANGVKVSSNKFNMENFMIKGLCDRYNTSTFGGGDVGNNPINARFACVILHNKPINDDLAKRHYYEAKELLKINNVA